MRRRALLSGGKKDYSQDYFTMVVTAGGDITWTGTSTPNISNTLSYSKNNGETWSTANSSITLSVAAGDKVLWKGKTFSFNGIGKFSGDTNVRYSIEGNVMSLIYGDDFKEQTDISDNNFLLSYLFKDNINVISAKNLSLPATTLAIGCYEDMFRGCTSLTTAPELPATTLGPNCYSRMFENCTNLTKAPELPATKLGSNCYEDMFRGCTSLTTAPELPATMLSNYCYSRMFAGCTSLTTAPSVLPVMLTWERYCYQSMFSGCTSLTTAPKLPSTKLTDSCYWYMFSGCTSLTTAPELPATTLADRCYSGMFSGCININSIKCLATDISAKNCTRNWVEGVSSSGTFTKATSMSRWFSGNDGIPSGWTVQNA